MLSGLDVLSARGSLDRYTHVSDRQTNHTDRLEHDLRQAEHDGLSVCLPHVCIDPMTSVQNVLAKKIETCEHRSNDLTTRITRIRHAIQQMKRQTECRLDRQTVKRREPHSVVMCGVFVCLKLLR